MSQTNHAASGRRTAGLRLLSFSAFVWAWPGNAHAVRDRVDFHELVRKSEVICSAKVKETKEWKRLGETDWMLWRSSVVVEKTLKGPVSPGETLVVITRVMEGGMEDPPSQMPEPESEVFLFLVKNEEGDWEPANSYEAVSDPRNHSEERIERIIREQAATPQTSQEKAVPERPATGKELEPDTKQKAGRSGGCGCSASAPAPVSTTSGTILLAVVAWIGSRRPGRPRRAAK